MELDQQTLIALAGAGFVILLFLFLLTGGQNSAEKRVKTLSQSMGGGQNKKAMLGFMKVDDPGQRRRQIEDSLSKIEEDQKNKKKQRKSLKAKIVQADWSITAQRYSVIWLSVGIIAGAGLYIAFKNYYIAGGVAVVLGLGIPRMYINWVIKRRQKKFTNSFADAMDIIVRGVRTGLPLGDCLKIIAHESPQPVAGEFLRVVEGEAVGVPIEVCLERMFERMPVPEVNFFATVLNIQKTTGGNLGESLSNLSGVLRGRKLLREKIKALSAEAKTSAMIIGALPIIVMVLVTIVSPDYMADLYYTDTGQRNLVIGAAMMVCGILVMRKMINFKI
ncbi:MAG: type II secretion system F family protein [Hellea sp.]|nr:type II secretion system F family protein [Hellea sp.]